MFSKSYRLSIIAGTALISACATAQIYPVEFSVSPNPVNVGTNTTFFVDVVARSTDGLSHDVSLAEVLITWNPSLLHPLDLGSFDPWYVPQNGFNMVFPPLPINSDGSQIGVFGGTNAISPTNIAVGAGGLSILKLRFTSLASNGSSNLDLPSTYGFSDFLVQYNDSFGVETVYGANLAGLHGAAVQIGAVPEPLSLAALAIGIVVLRRRQRKI